MGNGTLTLSGTNNTSNWGGNNGGAISIQSGSLLNNHDGNLTSWGGGVITINSGGTINADSNSQGLSLNLNDSLLINNGTVNGTTNVGYLATVSGSGTFSNLTNLVNGGIVAISSSASPQMASVAVGDGEIVGNGVFTAPTTIGAAPSSAPAALTVTTGSTLTFSGVIGGTGSLLKTGAGTLILSGSDSYTGGTHVVAGTLEVTSASALASGTQLTVGAGGDPFSAPQRFGARVGLRRGARGGRS